MERYAQISGNIIQNVIESETDPDGINGEWIACGSANPGWLYDRESGGFSPAPPPSPPAYKWYLDLGPFYDRFGAAKLAVLTATDPGVKAIIADLNIRKWVDLARPDVASALQYVGTQVPALTAELQTEILTTPVADHENLALRKLYFS